MLKPFVSFVGIRTIETNKPKLKNMTKSEAKAKLNEELKNLTPEQIVTKYSDKPFMELSPAEQDAVMDALQKSNNQIK